MCGIVGLFLKDDRLSANLGPMLSLMLEALSDRGPDSTGFAIYGESDAGNVKVTLYLVPALSTSNRQPLGRESRFQSG